MSAADTTIAISKLDCREIAQYIEGKADKSRFETAEKRIVQSLGIVENA
jgi:hypothetical protein